MRSHTCRSSSRALTVLAAAAAFLSVPAKSSAELICYDGFESSGEDFLLPGLQSGTGFSGAWTDAPLGDGTLIRYASNQGFPGFPANVYFPTPAGGRVTHISGYTPQVVTRKLTTALDFDKEGEYFLSFLWNDSSAPGSRDNEMRVFLGRAANEAAGEQGVRVHVGPTYPGPGYDALGIAVKDAWARPFIISPQAYSARALGGAAGANNLCFIVARYKTTSNDTGDTISAKVYPFTFGDGTTVDTSPAAVEWDVVSTAHITGKLDLLGIFSEGAGNPEVDEIRVGRTWADVVRTTNPVTARITAQPADTGVTTGFPVSLSVTATGTGALAYRWQKETATAGTYADLTDGDGRTGTATARLDIGSARMEDGGVYRVRVSDPTGAVHSAPVTLTVAGPPVVDIGLHVGIDITGTPGLHYRVEHASDPGAEGNWELLADIPALPSSPYRVLAPVTGEGARRFYRVVPVAP